MPKEGYESVTINVDMGKILDKIAEEEYCRTRSEVLRLLVRSYEKHNQVSLRNSGNGIPSHNLEFSGFSPFENNNSGALIA